MQKITEIYKKISKLPSALLIIGMAISYFLAHIYSSLYEFRLIFLPQYNDMMSAFTADGGLPAATPADSGFLYVIYAIFLAAFFAAIVELLLFILRKYFHGRAFLSPEGANPSRTGTVFRTNIILCNLVLAAYHALFFLIKTNWTNALDPVNVTAGSIVDMVSYNVDFLVKTAFLAFSLIVLLPSIARMTHIGELFRRLFYIYFGLSLVWRLNYLLQAFTASGSALDVASAFASIGICVAASVLCYVFMDKHFRKISAAAQSEFPSYTDNSPPPPPPNNNIFEDF
jgi:hypothetical protein